MGATHGLELPAPQVEVLHRPGAGGDAGEDVLAFGILTFCSWQQRAAAAALSPHWRATMGLQARPGSKGIEEESLVAKSGGYWLFVCKRLAEEHQVYVPLPKSGRTAPPIGVAGSWSELFQELYKQTMRDEAIALATALATVRGVDASELLEKEQETFKINVAARFRPAQITASAPEEDGVVLPLHQKVQLVRQQLGCSGPEALRLIMQQRAGSNGRSGSPTGELFQPCLSPGADEKETCDERELQVETEATATPVGDEDLEELEESGDEGSGSDEDPAATVSLPDAKSSVVAVREDTASVLAITRQSGLREFNFDRVFRETSAQGEVYELTARRLVMEFLNGTSASIICYGQTASGKTHTMFGPPSPAASTAAGSDLRGLVPRTCAEVLAVVQNWRSEGVEVQLGVSYVELFGSEVSDLLREGRVVGQGMHGRYSAVRATDRVGHRYVLDGHTECFVESLQEIDLLLSQGDQAKRRAATAMNERSTRAHTVFVLSLTVQRKSAQDAGGELPLPPRKSRFYFADLGGSEQLSKSKVGDELKAPVVMVGGEEQSRISWAEFYSRRQRVQETLNINKGLFSLKRVIETLHQRSRMAQSTPTHLLPYVPYQDSKLTMLLQEALGGSARTLVVTTATMDASHAAESLQTLRFGETCAQVKHSRRADQAATVNAALSTISEEIEALQKEIAQKERWETRLVRRQDVDTVAGAFGEDENKVIREEVIPTSVLVGAEAERERLELLLQRQAELQGLGEIVVAKDYRSMRAAATADAGDGGRGVDFRHRDRFSARTKAKDFEDEGVLADALRFLFRKSSLSKSVFGELLPNKRRVPQEDFPVGYGSLAEKMREAWEENVAQGHETRAFGKAMLDYCGTTLREVRAGTKSRDSELTTLLSDLGLSLQDVCEGQTLLKNPSASD